MFSILEQFMDGVSAVERAEARIRPYIRETPFEQSIGLSRLSNAEVFLKHEQYQVTGSFKVRGALSALLALAPEQRRRGIVAASSGNHGIACAYGLAALDVPGRIFVPLDASPVKLAAIEQLGVAVEQVGDDCLISEQAARRYADQHGLAYVSPYNDREVIAGQGTIGLELVRQASAPLDRLYIAVGGGGLIAGIAGYVKHYWPNVQIIGCQPEESPVMSASIAAGRIVDLPDRPTLSDGTAGGIEAGSITYELCRRLVDRFVLVSEAEIAAAIRWAIETQHTLIEGAAGVALGALIRECKTLRGGRAGVVLCGANIGIAALRRVLG